MFRSRWVAWCGLIVLALPLRAETVRLTAISQYLRGGTDSEQWETAFVGSASSLFLVSPLNGDFVNVIDLNGSLFSTEIDIPLQTGDNEFVALLGAIPDDLEE